MKWKPDRNSQPGPLCTPLLTSDATVGQRLSGRKLGAFRSCLNQSGWKRTIYQNPSSLIPPAASERVLVVSRERLETQGT